MFAENHKRVKKIGHPPGAAIYTGDQPVTDTNIQVTIYNNQQYQVSSGNDLSKCLPSDLPSDVITWIDVVGLNDTNVITQLAERFHLHPLTAEDILNVEQRPKVEEFENYLFITLKMLYWQEKANAFSVKQISFVLGKNFVLSFQEGQSGFFDAIKAKLPSTINQRLRQQGADYLIYRMIDMIVDQYFVVLEAIGDQIEKNEEIIINSPTTQNMRTIYRLKRQMLMLRKAVWPMREVIGHVAHVEEGLISSFTRVYLRDVYDHVVQAIDTLETFRDMLSTLMDVYLSSLTNRMNEVMKTLTIIATIFIPITTIASIYGMNFKYMPELDWHWGYLAVLCVMLCMAAGMLAYFWRKKWL